MSYLSQVFSEGLRLGKIAQMSSFYEFYEDTKIGSITVKAYEPMLLHMNGLHLNANQWQRPTEFLPERFDPTHPLAKTPSGQKRHTYAYLPFSGGTRICFGKNFAELMGKAYVTMINQQFDIRYAEGSPYNADSKPFFMVGQSHNPPIWLELRERK